LVRSEEPRVYLAGVLFFLSGAAALVYQVCWQRILALHSGVGLYSVAMIVGAFMAGLGLGSHLGGVLSGRVGAEGALRAFALLELAIGLFGAASPLVYYDWLYPRASGLPSPSWQGGLLHFAALLPPTALMGMSLPFLVRAMVHEVAAAGRTIGYLYGINVLGAAAGAFLAPWVAIPRWGIRGAVTAAAVANLVAGIGALLLGRRATAAPAAEERREAAASAEAPGGRPFPLWVALYALSGFTALSLEIVWFRIVDVAVKSTAFTFGTVLAIYLLGSAVGCLAGAPLVARLRRPLWTFLAVQCALLACSAVAVVLLARLPAQAPFYGWFVEYWSGYHFFRLGHEWDAGAVARLYVLVPSLLFGLPTLLMGFAFPVLQRAVHDDPRASGRRVGVLQAANIAGCVAGSLLVGLLSLATLGTTGTLRALMLCGVAFAVVGLFYYGRGFAVAAVALAALAAALPGQEDLWRRLHGVPPGPVVLIEEDATSIVALTPETPGHGQRWRLSINGKGNSWLPYGGVHTVLGALPALIHPAPVDVAIIGLGSGDTVWAASCRPETRAVRVFEISAPQPRLLWRLVGLDNLPELRLLLEDRRVRVSLADGRHALEAEDARYDMIEADAIWPEASYSGNLYSVEFFRRCARRLKPGGIMCTWAPTARVYASFRRVFPHVVETANGEILVGGADPIPGEPATWLARLDSVRGYLGAQRAKGVAQDLRRCRPAFREGRLQVAVNYDLSPRDEFAAR
jgi:predicted membrane-bound spermidine synthase